MVSDYRFRGLSRSDRLPAAQAGATLATPAGWYLSGFASSVGRLRGADAELDAGGGWTGALGPLTATGGVTAYLFPGGRGLDLYELQGALAYTLLTATLTAGLNYAPPQHGPPRAGRYAYARLDVGLPGRPVTLKAAVGDERGGEMRRLTGQAAKLDWRAGVEWRIGRAALEAGYVGTDLPHAVRRGRDGLTVGASLNF